MRDKVVGIKVHKSRYPYRAPATEYVVIPEASLSMEAVIIPGPIMDRKTRRLRQVGENFKRLIPSSSSFSIKEAGEYP
jgi:hypothetical protein